MVAGPAAARRSTRDAGAACCTASTSGRTSCSTTSIEVARPPRWWSAALGRCVTARLPGSGASPCLRYAELDWSRRWRPTCCAGTHPTDRPEVRRGHAGPAAVRTGWTCEGVRVTTPLRTAMDLACTLPRREALAAAGRAHARRTASRVATCDGCSAATSADGASSRPATLVPLVDGRSESSARDVDAAGDQRPRAAGARAAVVGPRRRGPDVPPRPGLPACAHRHRVRRRGVPLDSRATGSGTRSDGPGCALTDGHVIVLDQAQLRAGRSATGGSSELAVAAAAAQQKPQRWFAR